MLDPDPNPGGEKNADQCGPGSETLELGRYGTGTGTGTFCISSLYVVVMQ